MDPYKRYLIMTSLFLCAFAAGFLIWLQGLFRPWFFADNWLHDALIVKRSIAETAAGKRLVVICGSNALFGLDSRTLGERLNRNTVNLATHAGLPLEYLLQGSRPYLRPGDIVILPLEFDYYARTEDLIFSAWFTIQVLAWDKDFYDRLPPKRKAEFIMSFSPLRMCALLIHRLSGVKTAIEDPQTVMQKARRIWETGRFKGRYSIENMNQWGDMVNASGSSYQSPAVYQIQSSTFSISAYARKELSDFLNDCRRHGIDVFATWPCTIRDEGLRFETGLVQENIQKIVGFFEKHRVPIIGRPADFNLDRKFFLDTAYHLNEEGKALRTEKLITLLQKSPEFMERLTE